MEWFNGLHKAGEYMQSAVGTVRAFWEKFPGTFATILFIVSAGLLCTFVVFPITSYKSVESGKKCLVAELNRSLDNLATIDLWGMRKIDPLFATQAEAAAWVRVRQSREGGEPLCKSVSVAGEAQRLWEQAAKSMTPDERLQIIAASVERAHATFPRLGRWVRECKGKNELRVRDANEFRPTQFTSLPRQGEELCRIGNMTLYKR